MSLLSKLVSYCQGLARTAHKLSKILVAGDALEVIFIFSKARASSAFGSNPALVAPAWYLVH